MQALPTCIIHSLYCMFVHVYSQSLYATWLSILGACETCMPDGLTTGGTSLHSHMHHNMYMNIHVQYIGVLSSKLGSSLRTSCLFW